MELTDVEILEWSAGGQLIKDMSSISFMGWIASKLNGLERNAYVMELATAVANPPLTGKLAEESKIRYIRLLIQAGGTL